METTERTTPTAFSLLVDGQGVSVMKKPDGTVRIELTVGGPEGEWWGRDCTRGDVAKIADGLHVAAYANIGTTSDVNCGGGRFLSLSPRIMRQEQPFGSVPTDFVELCGYDSFGVGAVVLLEKLMAVALGNFLWAVIETVQPQTEGGACTS